MNKLNKLSLALIIGMMPLLQVNAAGVVEVGVGLYVPNYTDQELTSRGCEPKNWKKIVADYVTKRTNEKQYEAAQTNQYVKEAPGAQGAPGTGGACFQGAINTINSTIGQANKALAILNGEFDFTSLADNLINQFKDAACKQIEYAVGQQVNRVVNPINGAIGQGTGLINNGIQGAINSTGIQGVNVGNIVKSTNNQGTTGNIPYVGNPTNNTNQLDSQSLFNKLNPFK